MNAERQLIGSLLIDNSRYEDVSFLKAEMFNDFLLGDIFWIISESESEVNPLMIASRLKNGITSETAIVDLVHELVNEHDGSISDTFVAGRIFSEYKARKLNEMMDHMEVNYQNVDSMLEEFTALADTFNRAERKTEVVTISELTKLKDTYFTPKNEKRIKVGIEEVDKAIGGFDNGDTTLLAARPAVGKSAFALQFARKFGRDGIKTGYFNLEMGQKQIYERSIASASGIDMNRIRLGTNFLNNEKADFERGNATLQKETNVYVIPGTQSLKDIRATQKKYGFEVIIIDYLQLIKTEKRSSRSTEVGDISRGLKAIAQDFNIHVIALSQLNRVSEQNKDKEPSMSELRESGDLEQDASTIIMMWNCNRDDTSEKMIKVEKSRNGTNDRVKLYFDGKHMTFSKNDYDNGFRDSDLEEIPFK